MMVPSFESDRFNPTIGLVGRYQLIDDVFEQLSHWMKIDVYRYFPGGNSEAAYRHLSLCRFRR